MLCYVDEFLYPLFQFRTKKLVCILWVTILTGGARTLSVRGDGYLWLPKRFGVHKNLTGHGPVSFWPLYGRFVTGQMTVLSFRWWMVDIIAANGPVIFIAAFRPVKKPLDRPIDRSPVLFACRHNVNLRSQKKKKKK